MNTVNLDPNPQTVQNPTQNTSPIRIFFKSLEFVFRNAINEMKKNTYPTAFTAAAIPAAMLTGVHSLLILPIGWVAYNVFFGYKLLRQKKVDKEMVDFYMGIYKSLINPKLVESITNCKSLDSLKRQFASVAGTFKGEIRAISCAYSIYKHHFEKVIENQTNLEAFFLQFISNENDEAKLEEYRQIILAKIKEMQAGMTAAINKLPMDFLT